MGAVKNLQVALEEDRNEAFDQLSDRRASRPALRREQGQALRVAREADMHGGQPSVAVLVQMEADLKIYVIPDCVAMWCDTDEGLAVIRPLMVKRTAEYLLGLGRN